MAGLQRDSFEALRLEEESHVTVKYLCKQLKLAHRGLHMLTDILVEELSAAKARLAEKDQEGEALRARLALVEARQAEYAAWSQSAREDLVDLRRAVEREMTHEGAAVRRALAKQGRAVEELAARVEALGAPREASSRDARDGLLRAARAEAEGVARRAVAALAAEQAESSDVSSRRTGARLDALGGRFERLEQHVLDLVEMLKDRAQEAERDATWAGPGGARAGDAGLSGLLFS